MTEFITKKQYWLDSITHYIDQLLCYSFSKIKESYLLADGFDIKTKEVVYWLNANNHKLPISNFASQQHFHRLLTSLSIITQDPQYKTLSLKLTRYFLDNFTDKTSRLFYWGGHRFINLNTLQTEGPANKAQVHELKNHLPFYDLLYEANKEKTLDYIQALWNAHISDWHKLDLSRHGDYSKPFQPDVFLHPQHDVVDPKQWPNLPKTVGLTFINAGTDLIYAAYKYAIFTGDTNAYQWAKHLYRQYVLARCPSTGMPVYQYSSPLQRQPDPHDDNKTESWYGDRAFRQFGQDFGEIAFEANVLFRDMSPMDMWPMLMDNPLAIIDVMKKAPDEEVIQWVLSGLKNYYCRAYDKQYHTLKPMWGNGIDMTNYVFGKDGYYGKKGTILTPITFRPDYLLPLVQIWRLTFDPDIEILLIDILKNCKLIECDRQLKNVKYVNLNNESSSPNLIFALIELNLALNHPQLEQLIIHLADNLFKKHRYQHFFLDSRQHRFVRLDNIYPIALLAVIAYKQHCYEQIPLPLSKGGYVHGEYLVNGELKTIYDVNYIYQQTIY